MKYTKRWFSFEEIFSIYHQVKSGKIFIKELTYWIRQFNSADSNLNRIAMKSFMILPCLILQKPSAKSKSKDHAECIIRRLNQWKNADLNNLLNEVKSIQKTLTASKKIQIPR